MSLIDDYLQKLEVDSKVRVPNVYFTTDLCKPCLLNVYMGIIQDIPPEKESLRIFETGRILEEFWVNGVLRNTPGIIVVATQLPARYYGDGYEVHGRIDALTLGKDGLRIHEVKTARTSSWKTSPNEDHLLQLQFYLNALGIENGEINMVDKTIMLLGEDPRNPALPPDITYTVLRDPITYQYLLKRAEQLHNAVACHFPPPPTVCWACPKWCDYRDKCPAHQLPPDVISDTQNNDSKGDEAK